MTAPRPERLESARLFDETAVHDEAPKSASFHRRMAETLALIPEGTTSLLDVGCGRGDLLHRMSVPFTVGTDLARRGLRHLKRPGLVSSIFELPFPDRSFDVVLSAETLEHLPVDLLPQAAAEMRRVARKAVVITVPYDEDKLEWSHRCPKCGTIFHLDAHQRSFLPGDLKALFPDVRATCAAGCWPIRRWSQPLLRLRTGVFGLWKYSPHAQCPTCGNRQFRNDEGRLGYKLFTLLNEIRHPWRTTYRWLLFRADL